MLIVDDLEVNRVVLEEIISNMGCSPFLAESGETALNMVKKISFQLILTDISMPGMDGYELCRRLKKNDKTMNIPVVFISAFDNPKDIIDGFLLGGEDYITKPFISEIVQARVGVQLRLYEAKQELIELNRKLQVSVDEQLEQMEQEKKNILYALANISYQVCGYTKEHTDRLSKNCRILAQGMQLSPMFEDKISDAYVDTIELAAPLCDIGNIAVPGNILKRKRELTEEENALLKNHTNIGAEFLRALYANNDYNDFVSVSIDIIRHHHENWDGSGYPDALKKEQIPLAAQIVSIMEEYCTLTDNKDISGEKAFQIMKSNSGIKFNPDIFNICHKILRQLC